MLRITRDCLLSGNANRRSWMAWDALRPVLVSVYDGSVFIRKKSENAD